MKRMTAGGYPAGDKPAAALTTPGQEAPVTTPDINPVASGRPGLRTSEFYVTVATFIVGALGQVFKRDLSAYVPQLAAGLPFLVAAAYAVSRGLAKRPPAPSTAAVPAAPSVNVTAPAPQVTVAPVVNVPAPLPSLPAPDGATPLPPLEQAA